ncbi:MAG: hypothetical protein ACFFAV_17750, partial [Candidatus Hermodarchaeota archaeon]
MSSKNHNSKDLKSVLDTSFDKFYKKLLKKKLIRICIYIQFVIFYPGLIIAILIANKSNPLEGYNLINNYISDLGSLKFTPALYIYNSIVILTGIINIPIFLYLEEYLSSSTSKRKIIQLSSKSLGGLAKLGKIL